MDRPFSSGLSSFLGQLSTFFVSFIVKLELFPGLKNVRLISLLMCLVGQARQQFKHCVHQSKVSARIGKVLPTRRCIFCGDLGLLCSFILLTRARKIHTRTATAFFLNFNSSSHKLSIVIESMRTCIKTFALNNFSSDALDLKKHQVNGL